MKRRKIRTSQRVLRILTRSLYIVTTLPILESCRQFQLADTYLITTTTKPNQTDINRAERQKEMAGRGASLVPKRGEVLRRVLRVVFSSCLWFSSRTSGQSRVRSSSFVTPSLEIIKH